MVRIVVLIFVLSFQNFAFAQERFSSEDLKSDVKLLWSALNELHPGLYRHSETVNLENDYKKLLSSFSEEKSSTEVFLRLSEFTSKIKCGHTYLNPFNQKNRIISSVLQEQVLLPLTFVIVEDQIIVSESFSKGLTKGNVITHINNLETGEIIEELSNYVKSDGERLSKKIKDLEVHLTSKYEYFDYYFPMVYEWKDSVVVTLNNGTSTTIQLMNKEERKEAFLKRFPNTNTSLYDGLWKKAFYENHAYLQLGTFVTWRLSFDWEKYLDDFFEELEAKNVQNLIIDIRGNEGGLTDATNYLIKKLSKHKGETVFRKPHLAYKKVSDHIRPHISTWSKRFYNVSAWTKKMNENYRTIRFSANKAKRIKKNKKAFSGQTYLLVDESNSSATFILAEVCKKNNFGTLVGTETGGTKKGITAGQIFFLTLPKTKIVVDIPLIGRYPLEDLPDEGVQPDILVRQTLNDYLIGKDSQLEKAVELIKAGGVQ